MTRIVLLDDAVRELKSIADSTDQLLTTRIPEMLETPHVDGFVTHPNPAGCCRRP